MKIYVLKESYKIMDFCGKNLQSMSKETMKSRKAMNNY